MTWFKIDDGFHSHPKVLEAGNEAVGLYVRCGAYCAQHLTDGFVPTTVVLLYGSADLAGVLVRVHLWIPVTGGWRMNDYLTYNRSREHVQKDRADAAERQRRAREARALADQQKQGNDEYSHASSHTVTIDDCHAVTDPVTNGVSHGPVTGPGVTRPRPDPSLKETTRSFVQTGTTSSAVADVDRFPEFWTIYPNKKAKQPALRAWAKALKKVSADVIITGAVGYAAYVKAQNKDLEFVAHGATWLNQERYADYQPPPEMVPDTREPIEILRDLWRKADAPAVMKILGVRHSWNDEDPPPDSDIDRDRFRTERRQAWINENFDAALAVLSALQQVTA